MYQSIFPKENRIVLMDSDATRAMGGKVSKCIINCTMTVYIKLNIRNVVSV